MNYGASGLQGQYLASLAGDDSAFGATPAGGLFETEMAYGGVDDDLDVFGDDGSTDDAFGALDGDEEEGIDMDDLFGGLEAEDFGGLAEEEATFGAVPASLELDTEMTYGGMQDDDVVLFGAFEKATAKGRIAKLYRIAGRIQYLVDMGKVDTAREKAKKLLDVWTKLSAMADAQPLISAALQDVVAGLSAFASGQVNNPHDVGVSQAIAPGVAVDPTMTGGGWLGASVSAERAAMFAPDAGIAPLEIPTYVAPAPAPWFPRGPGPRVAAAHAWAAAHPRAAAHRRARMSGLGEDYGAEHVAQADAPVKTYRIKKGPGAGTTVTTTLGRHTFARCRRLVGAIVRGGFAEPGSQRKFHYPIATGPHKGKVVYTDLPNDAFKECVRVSHIADKGQSFGSLLGAANLGTDGLGSSRGTGLTPAVSREEALFGDTYGAMFADALTDEG